MSSSPVLPTQQMRDSNIELFRIVLMLMIIAHHYVVNSGVAAHFNYSHISGNQLFLTLWGWGGKTGINCFLLITGYFMCQKRFTWTKFLKLYLEIKFYKILIFAIFCLSGYQAFSLTELHKTVFNVAYGMGRGFAATFVGLFLLTPFINKLLSVLDKRLHLCLIAVLVTFYSIFGTFFGNRIGEDLGWYVAVYIIGAYLQLHPHTVFDHKKKMAAAALCSLLLAWASILAITLVRHQTSAAIPLYHFVADANHVLAIVCAVSFFLCFRSLDVGQNRLINTIASGTFGVLLIHAHGDTMRHWLWGDMLDVSGHLGSDWLWLHAIGSLVMVYTVCVAIDLLRQRWIERPFFAWLRVRFPQLN